MTHYAVPLEGDPLNPAHACTGEPATLKDAEHDFAPRSASLRISQVDCPDCIALIP